MLGPFGALVAVLGFALEVYVVVCSFLRRNFVHELPVNAYMAAQASVSCGLSVCLFRFGVSSPQYVYYYFYTDSLLTILLFWVVIHFYQHVFREMRVSQHLRKAALGLLLATAFFSYLVIHQNRSHLTSIHFVKEMGQNLYFVGLVLTYLLWGAVVKLKETRTRLVQLVLALGVYFSATAGSYAIWNLFPKFLPVVRCLLPVIGLWLPAAWAYTFTKVPENARLATASLLARAR